MIFSTAAFAVFMTVTFLIYWNIPQKYRWVLLLAANVYFYLNYDLRYIAAIVFTMIISYGAAILMDKTDKGGKKKVLFVASVLCTLSLLVVFKYLNFALYTVAKVMSIVAIPMQETTLKLIMPAGISFYTFEMVGYLADVYTGKIKAEKHFGKYAIFSSFFPNISSGPIERAGHFIPQIDAEKIFDYDKAVYNMRLIFVGLFKKLVIADMMSKYVDEIFNHVLEKNGICFAWATLLYTFQIYCDFSGYSDMAIGTAGLLGFDLLENFKAPYFASSIKEFWGRWHISLSKWFRDYVYIPLGGNRCSKLRKSFNLIVTFLVSGLWHGASWTFVLWGGIHGVAQVAENGIKDVSAIFRNKSDKGQGGDASSTVAVKNSPVKTIICTLITFCVVSYAWMFFRANSISEALFAARNMFSDLNIKNAMIQMGMSNKSVIKTTGAIFVLMVYDYFNMKTDLLKKMSELKLPIRWIIYIGFGVLIVAMKMHTGATQNFIYFNF